MHVTPISTEAVIGLAIRVHRQLGPGLLEKTYEECLAYELRNAGSFVEQQKHLPLVYNSLQLVDAYRVDLLVNDTLIIELKTADKITALHVSQVLTYLRLCDKHLGLIFNFNSEVLRHGIKRVVNNYQIPSAPSGPQRSPTIIPP